MHYFRFYYVDVEKIPIKAIRRDKAFINKDVPRIFGLWVSEKKSRKPRKLVWRKLKPRLFKVYPYPKIDPNAWFTYKRLGNGKVKRLTLAEYQKRKDK